MGNVEKKLLHCPTGHKRQYTTVHVIACWIRTKATSSVLENVVYVCNVMAHAQKPDFVFRRTGRVHLNRRGAPVQSTTSSRGVLISGSNAGYNMFRGSVKSTGYPLQLSVSISLPHPCVAVCHHVSTGIYLLPCHCNDGREKVPQYYATLTSTVFLFFRHTVMMIIIIKFLFLLFICYNFKFPIE